MIKITTIPDLHLRCTTMKLMNTVMMIMVTMMVIMMIIIMTMIIIMMVMTDDDLDNDQDEAIRKQSPI